MSNYVNYSLRNKCCVISIYWTINISYYYSESLTILTICKCLYIRKYIMSLREPSNTANDAR